MLIRKPFLVAVLALLAFTTKNYSQPLPDTIIKKIERLFYQWDKPNSPGGAMGIVRNDSLIYSKGFGMANLEYSIPNSNRTIFHIASVSKQFTAYCIVLLARQGKLNLDDDLRKYLPWFPDLGEKISIRNLMNHTSGIRDQWQLLSIQGTRLDDVITQDHIIKILGKQQELNFKPGVAHSYCNSNFTLMAEIVKKVSGQSFRHFADSAIFKPLGMSNTHFHDDYTEIVKNRADSYSRMDSSGFANSILSYSTVGATSLFTTVEDMSKWISNFYNHKVGDQQDIDVLTQKAKLTNGKELTYAAGIISNTYKGWKQFWHNGADAGFRTYIASYPELKMGVIVFGNIGDFNPNYLGEQLMNLFIQEKNAIKTQEKEEKKDTNIAVLQGDSIKLRKYLGSYISDEGIALDLIIKNQKLHYKGGDQEQLLIRESVNIYSMYYAPEIKFALEIKSKDTLMVVTTPDQVFVLKKYRSEGLSADRELQQYIGTYYSTELECSYGIELKDHQLILTNNKYNDVPIRLAGPDHLLNDNWWMNHLVVTRNKSNQVTGFEVNSGRVMHVKFTRVEQAKDR